MLTNLESVDFIMSLTLLTFITLQTDFWIRPESWTCLNVIAANWFTEHSLVVTGDLSGMRSLRKPVYLCKEQQLSQTAPRNTIIIYKGLSEGTRHRSIVIAGAAVIISESLDTAQIIWPKYRTTPLIVILQESHGCNVFIWTPFKAPECLNNLKFKWLSTCSNISIHDLLRSRQINPTNCSLTVSLVACPIFVNSNKNGILSGAEISILNDLTKYVKMLFVQYRPSPNIMGPSRLWYYTKYFWNGSLSGVWSLLDGGIVDMGASCQSIGLDKTPFVMLPSHLQDPTSWHLPGPQPKSLSLGFITVLPGHLWRAVGLVFLSTLIFAYGALSFKKFGFVFLWVVLRLLSMPSPPLRQTTVLRSFGLLLELCTLVITSIYRSLLLYNLFVKPMSILKTGEEGAQHGLVAYMREREAALLNYSNPYLLNYFHKPGRLNVTQSFDFNVLVEKKTGMIMARTILDQAQIRMQYPNVSFASAVYVDKHDYANNHVTFLMARNHPLADMLSMKLLEIIEAGLPSIYLKEVLSTLPGEGTYSRPKERKALGIEELSAVFYMWLFQMMGCFIVLVIEWLTYGYVKMTKRVRKLHFTNRNYFPRKASDN